MQSFNSENQFYDELENVFNDKVLEILHDYLPRNWDSEPIYYYFDIVEIRKFRSGIPYFFAIAENMDLSAALSIGACSELLFCASLILDDIIDEDITRSNQDAAHIKFDIPRVISTAGLAISVSNIILHSLAEKNNLNEKRLNQIRRLFDRSNKELMQSFLFERKNKGYWTTKEDYLMLLKYKTISGTAALASLGLLDDSKSDFSDILWEVGNELGIAGMIKNDIYDFTILFEARRSTFSDLKNKYYTYPLIKLIQEEGMNKKEVTTLIDENQHNEILGLLLKYDIFNRCKSDINYHVEVAKSKLKMLPISKRTKELLAYWADCNRLNDFYSARTGAKKN